MKRTEKAMRNAVELAGDIGTAAAAKRYHVTDNTIRNWREKFGATKRVKRMRAAKKAPLQVVRGGRPDVHPLTELAMTLDNVIRQTVRDELRTMFGLKE